VTLLVMCPHADCFLSLCLSLCFSLYIFICVLRVRFL